MSDKKNKEKNPSTTGKVEGIIRSLVSLVGVTAGIIITTIGVIMFLESIFKIYVFDLKQDRYNRFDYRCEQFDVDSIEARRLMGQGDFNNIARIDIAIKPSSEKAKKLTKEDKEFLQNKYKECKKEAKEEAQNDFQRSEKMDIAEGIAFMITGFTLLYFYQRKRKTTK